MAASGTRSEAPNATAEERELLERAGDKLSDSTRRAKWIHDGERADRKGQTLITRDHGVVRRWAEERGGRPAAASRGPDGRARTLRFDFGDRDAGLELIDWDEWLGVFDERELLFIHQDQKRDGSTSNFFRLESPSR